MTPDLSENFTYFGVFLLGLGLNLTPCVYPMLSITVSLFRSHKESSRAHAFLKSIVYVLGIATLYSTLGVITAFTGGLFGAALQNRWVLFGIGLLMTGMALSLFGLYVIQAPQWLVKMANKRTTDLIGIYLSGLFVGVFAAPCIGPLIIALIAFVASTGDPVFAFKTFFTLSVGLGLPYIILGTFTSLLHKLPKSGVWLVWMDRLFGTILLGVAAFYFMLAFFPKGVTWIFPVSLILGGIYLGFIEKAIAYSPRFIFIKRILGTMAILAGLSIIFLGFKPQVVWEKYSPQKMEQAVAAKKPVIMDFYADWCIPCHELDQWTYRDPKVIKLLKPFARFKVDLTSPEDEVLEALIDQYEIQGVPTVLFLDTDGKEVKEARITGFVPAKEFVEIFEESKLRLLSLMLKSSQELIDTADH